MNQINQLEDLYNGLSNGHPVTLFVAPKIRYTHKQSDYLYLFYKKLIASKSFTINDVSTIGHLKFVAYRLFRQDAVLHYHWLQYSGFFSGLAYFFKLGCVYLYILSGGKLVWSVHNKLPPDCKNKWLHFKVRKWMANRADRLVVECNLPSLKFQIISVSIPKNSGFGPIRSILHSLCHGLQLLRHLITGTRFTSRFRTGFS